MTVTFGRLRLVEAFTLTKVEDSGLDRGTHIILHMKEDMSEHLREQRVKDLVKTHSEFIG